MTCFSRIIMHNTDYVTTQVDEQGFSNNGPAITQNIKKKPLLGYTSFAELCVAKDAKNHENQLAFPD